MTDASERLARLFCRTCRWLHTLTGEGQSGPWELFTCRKREPESYTDQRTNKARAVWPPVKPDSDFCGRHSGLPAAVVRPEGVSRAAKSDPATPAIPLPTDGRITPALLKEGNLVVIVNDPEAASRCQAMLAELKRRSKGNCSTCHGRGWRQMWRENYSPSEHGQPIGLRETQTGPVVLLPCDCTGSTIEGLFNSNPTPDRGMFP